MYFYGLHDLTPARQQFLREYDQAVLKLLGERYDHPVRMRDWELCQVLGAVTPLRKDARILDTGSFNTYLGLYLARTHSNVTVSDRLRHRLAKSWLRRAGLAPAKSTEAPFFVWREAMLRHGVKVRSIDLTSIPDAADSFDCVVSLSVIEHIPDWQRAVAEMYRVLAPGGKLLLTTDCSPAGSPYTAGVRYFTEEELDRAFAAYPVTSPRNHPDFSRQNWCYAGQHGPVVTVFIEITKPR